MALLMETTLATPVHDYLDEPSVEEVWVAIEITEQSWNMKWNAVILRKVLP